MTRRTVFQRWRRFDPGARLCAALALVCVLLAVSAAPRPGFGQASEYAVKAAYLIKFAPFVDWPSGAFAGPDSPIVVCVAGKDPFGAGLDTMARSQSVGARRIVVRRLARVTSRPACHMLYLGGGAGDDVLVAADGAPVLTVTDRSSGRLGAINFVVRDKRVRFEIDEGAASRNGLGLSSKLLSLAVTVRSRRQGAGS